MKSKNDELYIKSGVEFHSAISLYLSTTLCIAMQNLSNGVNVVSRGSPTPATIAKAVFQTGGASIFRFAQCQVCLANIAPSPTAFVKGQLFLKIKTASLRKNRIFAVLCLHSFKALIFRWNTKFRELFSALQGALQP